MIGINALATRAGGAAVRVSEVARRAPAIWRDRVLLLRNENAGINVEPADDRIVTGWPAPVGRLHPLARRVIEPLIVNRKCRPWPMRALLHYGTYVSTRPPRQTLNVLCFVSLAPWGAGPGENTLRNRLLRALFERTVALSDLIIVQSAATHDALAERYPAIAARLAVLHNGILLPAVTRPAHPRGFLLLGDVHEYRRVDDVVRAYGRLDPMTRSDHPLTIAGHTGRDNNASRRLTDAIHTCGVARDVRLLGLVTRARAIELMINAAALVSYATVENGPNALCEAIALGVPAVVSDIPAHREFARERAHYAAKVDDIAEAMQDAAAAANRRTQPEYRAAIDTWDTHIVRLGTLLAESGVPVSTTTAAFGKAS